MAGIITLTIDSMTKEVPLEISLQEPTSDTEGRVSATDISFAYVEDACTITSVAAALIGTQHFVNAKEMVLVESTSGLNDGLYTIESVAEGAITLHKDVVLTTETAAAAGTVTVTCVAVYKITPTRGTGKLLIFYTDGIVSDGALGMIPCVLNGDYWAAKNAHYKQFTATVATPAECILFLETAPYLQDDGSMYFFLKPVATSTKLYEDHRPGVSFVELP